MNEGLEICVGDNCTGPDNENKFSLLLTNNKVGQSVGIKINDMNAGCPELAIRSINQFIWWVDIPSYKINGVQVPDQYLADTEIFPFNEQFRIKLIEGRTYIGLMQGFLTLPYIENAEKQLEWISYFDHDENIGEVIDYSGDTDFWYWESEPGGSGTGDSHAGIDFGLHYDTFLVASMPGYVSHEFTNSEGAKVARLANVNLVDKAGYYLVLTYGHHSEILLKNIPSRLSADNYGVKVYRGQIFLLSGMTGKTHLPHLHFGLHGNSLPEQGADFIAHHINGDLFLKVQLKGRLTFEKKYLGTDLYIAFQDNLDWYLFHHGDLLEEILVETNIGNTKSWEERGGYSFPRLSQQLKEILRPYLISN